MNPLVAPESHDRHGRTALSVNLNKVALLRNTRTLGMLKHAGLFRPPVTD